jgi:predicted PurR-regulated permease PerM
MKKVPLRTILVAILAVAFFYLAGKLIYRLRDVLLIILVAGFIAVILNPLVRVIEKYVVRRRGLAVTLVTVLASASSDASFRATVDAAARRVLAAKQAQGLLPC